MNHHVSKTQIYQTVCEDLMKQMKVKVIMMFEQIKIYQYDDDDDDDHIPVSFNHNFKQALYRLDYEDDN